MIKTKDQELKKKPIFKVPESPFIKYLQGFKEKDQRGILAALRRGLQQKPGTCIEMFPYIMPWVSEIKSKWEREVHYLIASLFAYYPNSDTKGNLGDIFRQIYLKRSKTPSLEQRFVALLKSNPEDLSFHLKYAISLAKSENIPINWQELFYDIKRWPFNPKFPPYEKWAQSFWKKEILENKNKK